MTKRVYLCGKMSGSPDWNFPQFKKYTAELRSQGYIVFSPAENDELILGSDPLTCTNSISYRQAMEDDLRWICRYADAIALIPGWETGVGTLVEKALADCLKLEVIYL